ncbi:hypothetical protein SAMN05216371_1541 [Streptomyces sp. TLI_053]|nr:hypothetical protein SAMN05216371_1541 [Streptomyces sp. TLI_053]
MAGVADAGACDQSRKYVRLMGIFSEYPWCDGLPRRIMVVDLRGSRGGSTAGGSGDRSRRIRVCRWYLGRRSNCTGRRTGRPEATPTSRVPHVRPDPSPAGHSAVGPPALRPTPTPAPEIQAAGHRPPAWANSTQSETNSLRARSNSLDRGRYGTQERGMLLRDRTESRTGSAGSEEGHPHALPHQHHRRTGRLPPAFGVPVRNHRGAVPFIRTDADTFPAGSPGRPAAARRCRHRPPQLAARIRRTSPMPTLDRPRSGPVQALLAPASPAGPTTATVGRR